MDLGGLWIPFQACSGQASAHPAGRGRWAWRAEHQKAWDAGIGGVVRACLPRPRAQGPPAALTVGCTLFPAAPGVSCRVRTGLSQSQCEKAGEAPHRPAPPAHEGPSAALRGITMGALGAEGRSFARSAQATPLLPLALPPPLPLTPVPWTDSGPREGSGPRAQAVCGIYAPNGSLFFPSLPLQDSKARKNLKISPAPTRLSCRAIINHRPQIKGQ